MEGAPSLSGIHPCQGHPCPAVQNICRVLQTPCHKIEDAVRTAMGSLTLQSMPGSFRSLI